MKAKEFFHTATKLVSDINSLPNLCVSAYIKIHNLDCSQFSVLSDFINDVDAETAEKVIDLFSSADEFSLSLLIEVFESVVPFTEKKSKGVTYTPKAIKKYIVQSVISKTNIPHICDPSCGCGSFLLTAANYLHESFKLPYKEIFENYIFGADINPASIEQAKVLFSLLALENEEDCIFRFNLISADMMDKFSVEKLLSLHIEKYDCVVGNPPYVRSRNIDANTKAHLSEWESAKSGNVDLYIPFFEAGLSLLKENGKLGYITPNTYMQAVNGRSLRNFISANGYNLKIVDFRDAQIFETATNYTCITLIDKDEIDGKIDYCRLHSTNDFSDLHFSNYNAKNFAHNEPWRLASSETDEIIYKLEHAGTPISHWKIRNGLATLKNDLFFFYPEDEDDDFYYRNYNGKKYKVEKNICIKIAKPNILKDETDLKNNKEVAIFPYSIKGNSTTVIDEQTFSESFPNAYQLLLDNKQALAHRDKGNGKYEAWYAYGRTQGMNNFGKKLLIPYISGSPIAILSTDENLLFYCGYALFSDDEEELKVLKAFLESNVFWYYVSHTSKPYSKGYMSFAKNYIKNFSIPKMTSTEKKFILTTSNRTELEQWISDKYTNVVQM